MSATTPVPSAFELSVIAVLLGIRDELHAIRDQEPPGIKSLLSASRVPLRDDLIEAMEIWDNAHEIIGNREKWNREHNLP